MNLFNKNTLLTSMTLDIYTDCVSLLMFRTVSQADASNM